MTVKTPVHVEKWPRKELYEFGSGNASLTFIFHVTSTMLMLKQCEEWLGRGTSVSVLAE